MLLTQLAATRTVHCLYRQILVQMCAFLVTFIQYICCTLCCFPASFNTVTWLLLTAMAVCSFVSAVFWFFGSHTTVS